MFTPKNIQGALEELYDLCDPDYMVDMHYNPFIRARFFFVKRKMNFVITMVLSAVAQHCSTSSIKRKFWLTAKMIINGMCW